jgi:hypothetical protein
MKESEIESKSIKAVKDKGWWLIKFLPMKCAGLPDRIAIGHGKVVFIEYKRPGEKLRPIQVAIHKRFLKHGITVHVAYSVEDTLRILEC